RESENADWKGRSKSRSMDIEQGLLRFIISELMNIHYIAEGGSVHSYLADSQEIKQKNRVTK
ncbi:hypothetical protein, partial [Acidithiobacillus thiooxidans]|uniref:hypothetical protein n=1 Tax=Acidithiobacillus thiooxidans TaxID=930 RepID=UPI000ACEC467